MWCAWRKCQVRAVNAHMVRREDIVVCVLVGAEKVRLESDVGVVR